jgi:type II secretory pathway pseudopilin PulG
MRKNNGFSLIELIIFIVVLAIGIGVLLPITTTLTYIHHIDQQTQALELAGQRMELILAQKHLQGFNYFTDPCVGASPPAVCTVPSGYSVNAVITDNWAGDSNYKIITVTASGLGNAELQTLVTNY